MICPECKKQGLESRVYPGMSMTTAMFFQPFYDEKGELHHHDNNTTTTDYRCSNGHEWEESHGGKCWCGWDGDKKMKEAQ